MMIWFWMAAAALSGGAALLVILFARTEAAKAGGEDPALAVHRRQLLEIDELADRGLLNPADQAATRAEAARRLLSSADLKGRPQETAGSQASRLSAALAAVAAAGAALCLYLVLGAPGDLDQPYRRRLAGWLQANPATLDAPKMAAVLQTIAARRPNDPEVFGYLGRAESAAGDPFAAQRAFARAAAIAPGRADYQMLLGEALLDGADGQSSDEAAAAFRRALAIDPTNLPARYSLGRLEIAAGDRAGGLDLWRGILTRLASADPRRIAFAKEVDRIASGGPLEAPPPADAGPGTGAGPDASAATFIRGMVASLAAKLAAHPDDPEGWARLVRSYGVLHDPAAQADARVRARRALAGHPDALATIEHEAQAHPTETPKP